MDDNLSVMLDLLNKNQSLKRFFEIKKRVCFSPLTGMEASFEIK